MRRTKLTDFTGGDVIRLVSVLFLIKSVYTGFSEAVNPTLRAFGENLNEQRRIRQAEEILNSENDDT